MANKEFKVRVQMKRDIEANFEAVKTTFVPLKGEIVIVETSEGDRLKIGDGITNYQNLKFQDSHVLELIDNLITGVSSVAKANTANSCSGNAVTATKLATPRKIGDTSFDGTADITLSQIGAASTSHIHNEYAPKANPVFTGTISMNRKTGDMAGDGSVAVGYYPTASGKNSHAEGFFTTANGDDSHAEGYFTVANGEDSHAEGDSSIANGKSSHAEGCYTVASGDHSHAEGYQTKASNIASFSCGKCNNMTDGGELSNTTGDAMVIGNGTYVYDMSTGKDSVTFSNCFRVTYAGEVYGLSEFKSKGADYAEYFEWIDGNPDAEDRVGYFVTMDGKKIRFAKSNDYILGVVSGQPCIIGNADEDWFGRWEHDEFGRFILEYLEEEKAEIFIDDLSEEEIIALHMEPGIIEENGRFYKIISKVVNYKTPSWRYKANPNYDPSQQYIERKNRPEWSAVGMMGVLSVRDDGTCQINEFCKVTDGGIATATNAEFIVKNGKIIKNYRVIERVSENIVKIIFR